MHNEEKVRRFNHHLDAILRGDSPEDRDPALDLAQTLAQVDLSPRSRRRMELRRQFQLRQAQCDPGQHNRWLGGRLWRLVQAGSPTGFLASVLVLVFLSSVLTIFFLPGRTSPVISSSPPAASLVSAPGSQPLQVSPQPIPTPYGTSQIASPAPVVQTHAPATTGLAATQIYTRLPPKLLPDNKP